MPKKKVGLTTVQKGSIDTYFVCRIESALPHDALCHAVQSTVDASIERYRQTVAASLKATAQNAIQDQKLSALQIKAEENPFPSADPLPNGIEIEQLGIAFTQNGFRLTAVGEADNVLDAYSQSARADYQRFRELYGDTFVSRCDRLYLPPYRVRSENGSKAFITAILYIFQNKMAILRISLPLQNASAVPMMQNDADRYITEITDIFSVGECENNLFSIKDAYLKYILGDCKALQSITSLSPQITNTILADYDAMPESVTALPDALHDDLYRIICAPIQIINGKSLSHAAKTHMQNHSLPYDGFLFVTNSMGRCLSIVDQSVVKYLQDQITEEDAVDIYDVILHSTRQNIEFSILIMLLSRCNADYTYFQKQLELQDYASIQKEYNQNRIFITDLQRGCYGSVRDQLTFLREKMTYYTDAENAKEKMDAMDAILYEERERKKARFQDFISKAGILLTCIFALPAIYDTLSVCRRALSHLKADIPFFTAENTSILLWALLIVALVHKTYIKRGRTRASYHRDPR